MSDKVLIAVQARSTSTRLPMKWAEDINGKSVMERVISSIKSSAIYINNGKGDVKVQTCLVVPHGDPISKKFSHDIAVFEGPEDDVLTRYHEAATKVDCDYIVRITGDSPMIPAFLITKHILTATKHNFDYTSNVEPSVRTAPCGHDCEVMSRHLIDWLNENADAPYDREHVTTYARSHKPEWARYANLVSYTDNSHLKLSVDTQEDLEFIRIYDDIINKKIRLSKQISEGFFRI